MTDIKKLSLDYRSFWCLKNDGVETIEQLSQMTNAVLLRIPNLGPGTIVKIRTALDAWKLLDPDNVCEKCRFFRRRRCVKRSPVTLGDVTVWPAVSSADWCGDFENHD